jgi:hypothetical protein
MGLLRLRLALEVEFEFEVGACHHERPVFYWEAEGAEVGPAYVVGLEAQGDAVAPGAGEGDGFGDGGVDGDLGDFADGAAAVGVGDAAVVGDLGHLGGDVRAVDEVDTLAGTFHEGLDEFDVEGAVGGWGVADYDEARGFDGGDGGEEDGVVLDVPGAFGGLVEGSVGELVLEVAVGFEEELGGDLHLVAFVGAGERGAGDGGFGGLGLERGDH